VSDTNLIGKLAIQYF